MPWMNLFQHDPDPEDTPEPKPKPKPKPKPRTYPLDLDGYIALPWVLQRDLSKGLVRVVELGVTHRFGVGLPYEQEEERFTQKVRDHIQNLMDLGHPVPLPAGYIERDGKVTRDPGERTTTPKGQVNVRGRSAMDLVDQALERTGAQPDE